MTRIYIGTTGGLLILNDEDPQWCHPSSRVAPLRPPSSTGLTPGAFIRVLLGPGDAWST